ncbi:hypothetical protein [Thermodesulfobacterium hydrogeniphilum]|uniref:hypothetical protein n=1 Tax=Thermodesulfobacterium hydrogeniphilum TaxID=161156 RepID=UPI00056E3F8B|nr:hypothetical protein [Thermodesulfobacterium hydrogeniphilum]
MNFYTVEWIKEIFKSYQEKEDFFIEDKEISFEPKYFLLALLHIYNKKDFLFLCDFLNLNDLEKIKKDQEFDFMYLVDLLRKEFSYWFKENLLFKDFSEKNYFILAHEFLILEEQVKKQIQIPLLDQLKKFIMDLDEIIEKNNSLDNFEESKFLRLFKFFNIVEKLEPSLSSRLINRAKETAKKAYKENYEQKFALTFANPFEDIEAFKRYLKNALYKELKEN